MLAVLLVASINFGYGRVMRKNVWTGEQGKYRSSASRLLVEPTRHYRPKWVAKNTAAYHLQVYSVDRQCLLLSAAGFESCMASAFRTQRESLLDWRAGAEPWTPPWRGFTAWLVSLHVLFVQGRCSYCSTVQIAHRSESTCKLPLAHDPWHKPSGYHCLCR
jgi:hypothetical protein